MAVHVLRDAISTHPSVEKSDAEIGARSGLLSVEIADLAGIIGDLANLGQTQQDRSGGADAAAQRMADANDALAQSTQTAKASAHSTQEDLAASADEFAAAIADTAEKVGVLGDGAAAVHRDIEEVAATISAVRDAGEEIQKFAYDTQLLAFNARIEAAHAGSAGAGFSVIASEVESLADNIRRVTSQNHDHLQSLTRTLAALTTRARNNAETAQIAKERSKGSEQTIAKFSHLVETIRHLMQDIEQMTRSVEDNANSYGALREELDGLTAAVEAGAAHLQRAHAKAESILGISEDFILFVAESGVRSSDSAIIELCQATAAKVAAIFERAVASGDITQAALFDEKYVPIKGTDPQQVMTKFVALTDRKLRALQEELLSADPRITFGAAVDRNGYLPTHNLVYSKPQGPDPVWNAANCRNRRIFNDRTGLSAGRNQRPFLLQTYRRDMGGGAFVMMKDVSAPIVVNGRHWGGFRIGFKV
jgi:methyl-accepting chemotaxis protein